jgi:glucuronate isomerase
MLAEENKMRMDIAWEEKYAEFKRCMEMPEVGTPLHNWQKNQLRKGRTGLDAKIRKEIAENEGSTVWRERKLKLSDSIKQMIDAKRGNAWEKRYAEFVSYDGMPKKGTPLYTWQRDMFKETTGLNAKIREENAENKGSIWSDRKKKLAKCVEQKRCE